VTTVAADRPVALAVRGLRKSYGASVAVDGVSFEVRRGETFGLLGPNGAGKTTTILLLVGALRGDAGSIEIDGATDPTRPEVRRRIGVAPQSIALYDPLTAEENLAFFGRIHGLAGAALADRVAYGLGFAGLADRARERVGTFSGGMKRRLNVACALLHDRRCSSSTSRRSASTPSRGTTCSRASRASATPAARCSTRRT